MVSVSEEALMGIKAALGDFRNDISGFAPRVANKIDLILAESREKIASTENDVAQSETRIKSIEKAINATENQISHLSAEIDSIEKSIPQIRARIHSLNEQITSIRSQISALRAQLAKCDNDEQRQEIQSQIDMLESKLAQNERAVDQLTNQIQNAENRKKELKKRQTKKKKEEQDALEEEKREFEAEQINEDEVERFPKELQEQNEKALDYFRNIKNKKNFNFMGWNVFHKLYKTETPIYYLENFVIMNMPFIGKILFNIRYRVLKILKRR